MEDPFSIDLLHSRLVRYPPADTYLVGFSGGADSTALLQSLHCLSPSLEARIAAIHFNHGLDPACAAWELHCREFCSSRGIDLEVIPLALNPEDAGVEARARTLRYAAVDRLIDRRTLYLTAHNLDDRVETFLLHALRGSGVQGLASIPEIRPLGKGHVARPLLDVRRAALEGYLIEQDVAWIEDRSNQDSRFDRNFIRNEVIPLLETRWPAAKTSLARSSRHLRAAASTIDSLLGDALEEGVFSNPTLATEALFGHGDTIAPMILRAWLSARGAPSLPQARQATFLMQAKCAAPDSKCKVTWAGWSLRLFRDQVHLLPPGGPLPCPDLCWTDQTLDLGPGLGALTLTGPDAEPQPDWRVGPRRPGEKIRLYPGGPSRKLKKVMQELPIPPWQRTSIPILSWEGETVAVGDWLLAPRLAAWLGQSGLGVRWSPTDPSLVDTRHLCHQHFQSVGA